MMPWASVCVSAPLSHATLLHFPIHLPAPHVESLSLALMIAPPCFPLAPMSGQVPTLALGPPALLQAHPHCLAQGLTLVTGFNSL